MTEVTQEMIDSLKNISVGVYALTRLQNLQIKADEIRVSCAFLPDISENLPIYTKNTTAGVI